MNAQHPGSADGSVFISRLEHKLRPLAVRMSVLTLVSGHQEHDQRRHPEEGSLAKIAKNARELVCDLSLRILCLGESYSLSVTVPRQSS
jgi:hypothetical protein